MARTAAGRSRLQAFAQIEIERLVEMRLVATEDRIDADLALGRHRQARSRAGADGRRAPAARARARSGDAGAVSLWEGRPTRSPPTGTDERIWSTNWGLSPDPR